ncbi:MAG TPA: amidohydrolase [Candidatus Eremiobacteraceae bacterium]|nr:amidohydrolase [Candidatus Eremiobacteraceae bacterium]
MTGTVAFTNARLGTPGGLVPHGAGVLVSDGKIERVLDTQPAGLGREVAVVDCGGGALYPGFHDCHMHLTGTGLTAGEHDIGACRDVPSILAQVARLREPIIFAASFEDHRLAEGRPPLRKELDAVTGTRPCLLSRIDGHSCVVNSAAAALFDVEAKAGAERAEDGTLTGRLFEAANYHAQNAILAALPVDARRRADDRAAHIALRAGITTLHNVIEGDAPLDDLQAIYRANAGLPVRVISKSCTHSVQKARALGGRLFGGDIFLDGSIGSRTAAVAHDYCDDPQRGHGKLYVTRDHLVELFDEAAEAGLSLGVHAIGDRAIEEAIAAWEVVIAKRGPLPGLRPSIDHFEIAHPDQIARAARCGLLLSMQPAFDYLWGGDGGMYADRFGSERAREMNLFKSARRAGCVVCGGSDSPVTKLSALLGMHSLINHHVAAERYTVDEALAAYTSDAAMLAYEERERGTISAGMAADFTILERSLDEVAPEAIKDLKVMKTVIAGEVRYDADHG